MGVVGAVVDAAIGWLVQSILVSFFTKKMEAWARDVGLAEDVENLKFEMRNVQMVLAAAKGKRIENEPLAQSLLDLKDLLYDAEDVMDELASYRLLQQIEQGDGCTNPEKSPVSSSTQSIFQQVVSWPSHGRKRKREEEPSHCTMLPYEIKPDISERIKGIVNGLHKLGNSVREILHLEILSSIAMRNQNQFMVRNTRLTGSSPIEDKVYGRDAERDKIIELLINGKSNDLQVLPIVGIGGVGKTTLARFVYNDQRIKEHFDLQMWVCVSTNFDTMRLTREILEHVCTDRQQFKDITSFNALQQIHLKNLENKRFLLVFDDMWEEKDRRGWFTLLAPLKHNHVSGCMILATTRRPSVARMIKTMDSVSVNGLNEKQFWLFFKACAFGNESHEGHHSLQSIGQQIVKSLKGIPLAARSVGALLNRNLSYKHWMTVQNKWKSLQEDTDDILPILKLSYDFLPVHLQHCFSYCSLFPEDYQFDVENLVRVWISQNFVQCEDPTKRLEEIGKQYMDDLVDLGFFQKVGDSHHVMHDLMHELAQMVSLNECATITGFKTEAIQPSVRHVSIITDDYDVSEYFLSKKFEEIVENIGSLKKLRTLMVFGRSSINLLKFLLTLCKKSKTLRVIRIYVTNDDVGSTLNLLSPYHLRYLEFIGVSSTTHIWPNIDCKHNIALPQALTKLYHLQYLDARIGCNISVPTDMNNLVNLRKLHTANEKAVLLAIAGVGKLTSLQGLAFKVQNAGNFEIKQLQSMNNLVTLEISQLENVKTKEEASGARLIDKEYLEELSFSWNGISMGPNTCTAGSTEDVLEGLQPHDENLKSLCITRYRAATPTWFASNVSFMNLQSLHLENCSEWQILPSLEMLQFLRKLKLIRMWKLMEISIPSLEELVLIEMPKLEKCLGTYGMELTSHLKVIVIEDCPQLNEITLFQSYSSFVAEQQSWFPFLSKLAICYCPHIIKWEILPLGGLQALKELKLIDLHLIRDLSVPSLAMLVLIKMSSLERCRGLTASPLLPSQEEQEVCLSNLERLVIHDCPSLMISRPLPPNAFIWGRKISIRGKLSINIDTSLVNIESSEFSVLDDRILKFNNLRDITRLSIKNCSNLMSISSDGFSQLTSLMDLSICKCPNLLKPSVKLEAASENSSGENIPAFPSLKHLEVSSSGIAGGWLTKMLSHMRSLEELILRDCPQIKWLWISQSTATEPSTSLASAMTLSEEDQTLLKVPSKILCSLKQLTISECVDLEFYAGMGGFGGFTTVEVLDISDCPKLGSLLGSDMDAALFLPPSLKKLSIYGCPKLASLLAMDTKYDTSNVDVGLFPSSLESLELGRLPENLQSYLPKGLAYLKKLTLMSSQYLKSIQLNSCKALKELEIWDCVQLGVLEGLQFLTSLRSLEISGCEQLDSLDGLQLLTSLKSLKIEMNPELSAAWDRDPNLQEPEHGGNQIGLLPPSITRLEIWNLTNNVQSRLLSCLPAYTELAVWQSPELTSLQLAHCPALTKLEISNCESLASLHLGHCTSLTELEVGDCESLASLQLGCCTALTKLKVGDCKSLASLHLGHCTALTELKVGDCKSLASLHLGHCTALTKFEIRDCESLASTEGFQFITNLTSFTVAASSSLPPWMELLLQQQGGCEVLSRLTDLEIGDASVLTMSLCQQLTSLQCLEFKGKGTNPMVRLTEEQERALQLLTSLQELGFFSCPNLQLLPADLRSLASLKYLSISSCPSISRLSELAPSCQLYVYDCSEELSQLCNEWVERRREMADGLRKYFKDCTRDARHGLLPVIF